MNNDDDVKTAATILKIRLIRNIDSLDIPVGIYDKEPVAILRCSLNPCFSEKHKYETDILRLLDHKNVQRLIEFTVLNDIIFIATPFMDLGSAKHILSTAYPKGFPEPAILSIVYQLVNALTYIHEHKIIHRSVKCSHILLDSSGLVRLGGFHHAVLTYKCNRWIGIESNIHAFDESLETSFSWLAPELLRQGIHGYSYNSDIYSLGITLCEMGNGFPPFEEMEPLQIMYEKLRGSTPFILDAQTNPTDSNAPKKPLKLFSSELHDLVQKCLIFLPSNRPTSHQLLEHSFLRLNKSSRTFKELLPASTPL